jgi:hypothetical protein
MSILLSSQRGQCKPWQVENCVSLLQDQCGTSLSTKRATTDASTSNSTSSTTTTAAVPTTIASLVNFGCHSGNLCLALAATFPHVTFVLVDKKGYSLQLAKQHANEAGLTNVRSEHYDFSPSNLKDFLPVKSSSFDLGIGLHCCGSFTDMGIELCQLQRAKDYIVCPCRKGCIILINGNTRWGNENDDGWQTHYDYPQSTLLRRCMTEDEILGQLSRSADHNDTTTVTEGTYAAKYFVEYCRAEWVKEDGF